nr:PREDICTED: receptor-like protein 12 [Daucus carota subsp. sativus]
MFSGLKSLGILHLSYNSLSVRTTTMATLPPTLNDLALSSCNMKEFPHFSRDANIFLDFVDLSNNKIEGEIPHWIGSVGRYPFYPIHYLNLSHNGLICGLEQLPWSHVEFLDLQYNKLNGSLPTLMCNSSSLRVLNLSHNKLSGVLPICHTNLTSLRVLDLRRNKIQGNIPATLSNFRNLETVNLNGNRLEGSIPSSFAGFDSLAVLDLGNNQINDTFPQCLEALPNLQVLVLKSNKFYGLINTSSKIVHPFPSLRIIDLSKNEFSGPLPAKYFRNFKAMMDSDVSKIDRSYMNYGSYYSDSTTLVIKGVDMELVKILTIFTTMDVSRNHFEGEIVESIGNLVSLRDLNLSYNHLTGHIPRSIGKLTVLESLDLSSNELEGEIPSQLTGLYSLAVLNLSCNQLSGHIPQGSQFNTFDADSYGGNFGLCGNPLSKTCEQDIVEQEDEEDEDECHFFCGFTWEAVVIGYGCGVVPAFISGYLMLLARKPKWFAGIIGRELGLKIRRMEIRMRY